MTGTNRVATAVGGTFASDGAIVDDNYSSGLERWQGTPGLDRFAGRTGTSR